MDVDAEQMSQGSPLDLLKQWAAAGVANAFTSALLNPFDVAKTRMQLVASRPSLITTLRGMYSQGGVVRGLFLPGLSASMVREMLSSGPRAGFYVPVRTTLLSVGLGDETARISAALVTGTLGSVIANPVDVVKIRQMRDPHTYGSLHAGLFAVLRDEGVGGLYKGLAPSTLRAAFIAVGELATYDIAKQRLRAVIYAPGEQEGVALHVTASLVTGVVASFVAAPFDLIKARAMSAVGSTESIASVVRALAREGGFPLSLLRGVVPAYMRLGPHALICFPIFEQLRALLSLDYL